MIIPGQFGFNFPSSRHFPFYIKTNNLNFVKDHPMNIPVLVWIQSDLQFLRRRHLNIFPQGSMLIYVLRWQPSWISDRHKKRKLFRGPSNDYSWAVWFQLSKQPPFSILYRNKKPKLCRRPSNEYSCLVWIQSDLQFLRRRHLNISPQGPMLIYVQSA